VRTFDVEVEGQTVTLAVVRPTRTDEREATRVYDKAFRQAITGGSLTREQLNLKHIKSGRWDQAKGRRADALLKDVFAGEKKLADPQMTPEKGRSVALKLRKDRTELLDLVSELNERLSTSAEAAATQARFEYLVAACTVYPATRKLFFS
jgi:hypothetical protein